MWWLNEWFVFHVKLIKIILSWWLNKSKTVHELQERESERECKWWGWKIAEYRDSELVHLWIIQCNNGDEWDSWVCLQYDGSDGNRMAIDFQHSKCYKCSIQYQHCNCSDDYFLHNFFFLNVCFSFFHNFLLWCNKVNFVLVRAIYCKEQRKYSHRVHIVSDKIELLKKNIALIKQSRKESKNR